MSGKALASCSRAKVIPDAERVQAAERYGGAEACRWDSGRLYLVIEAERELDGLALRDRISVQLVDLCAEMRNRVLELV